MSKRDLLLEIGLEEMPARFVTSSMEQLSEKVQNWLKEKKVGYEGVSAFSTPRRLAVLVEGVREAQEDTQEEVKGPAKKIALDENGQWTKAAIGFTRGQGMTVDDIYFKEVNGVEYCFVEKFTKGEETVNLLPQLKEIITGLSFPINMYWGIGELRYIRPIKWITVLYGQELIPISVAGVSSSNWSMGHRFLGKKIVLSAADEYEKALAEQFVIADPEKRKEMILAQIKSLEEENNWVIPVDEELLEEVNNLVEYPTALYGRFSEEFLRLPDEVLITSMKEHQRYFPVKSKDGKLLPYFVTVRNGDDRYLDIVAKGNEKVLHARLADAVFFYEEDGKLAIDDCLAKLETIVYHEEIGTLAGKVNRVRKLTNQLADLLAFSPEDKKMADRAAEICKFDLVTNMVNEFPELQGFMGEKYALQKGEPEIVAKAINEHYMPRNAEDSLPSTAPGSLLAVAEKMDTIAAFFAIGNIPTGSQDPYALRRQASGVVQILAEKGWKIALEELIDTAVHHVAEDGIPVKDGGKLQEDILAFCKLRLKYLLQERHIRYDIIDSVLASKVGVVSELIQKAEVLQDKLQTADFKENIEALGRVLNIAVKAEGGPVKAEWFENEYEHQLYNKYLHVKQQLEAGCNVKDYFDLLVSLKDEINQYFDHTMVMVDDERIRRNRLNLMHGLAELIKGYADFNKIRVK